MAEPELDRSWAVTLFVRLFGWAMSLLVASAVVTNTVAEHHLFTEPRYAGLWRDAEAYHLHPERRERLAVLCQRYGTPVVMHYVIGSRRPLAAVPADDAAFSIAVARALNPRAEGDRFAGSQGLLLLMVIVPTFAVLRGAQRVVSWVLCRSPAAVAARREYFAQVRRNRLGPLAVGFLATAAAALVNVAARLTPEHEAANIRGLSLLPEAILFAYTGGLVARGASYAVGVALLARGANPHRSLWDDALALAAVALLSALVYHNTVLSVLTQAVAGLAAGLAVKALVARGDPPATREEDEYRRLLVGAGP